MTIEYLENIANMNATHVEEVYENGSITSNTLSMFVSSNTTDNMNIESTSSIVNLQHPTIPFCSPSLSLRTIATPHNINPEKICWLVDVFENESTYSKSLRLFTNVDIINIVLILQSQFNIHEAGSHFTSLRFGNTPNEEGFGLIVGRFKSTETCIDEIEKVPYK